MDDKSKKEPGKQGYSQTPIDLEDTESPKSICLASGACCSQFDVSDVPGYGETQYSMGMDIRLPLSAIGDKLEAEMSEQEIAALPKGTKRSMAICRWLVPANKNQNGQWQPAKCMLHDKPSVYPKMCQEYAGSGPWEGACKLGLLIWRRQLREEGGTPPPEIKGFFEEKKEGEEKK